APVSLTDGSSLSPSLLPSPLFALTPAAPVSLTDGGAYLVRHCCSDHCDIVDLVLQRDSPDQLAVCLKDRAGQEWWSSDEGRNWRISKYSQSGWSPRRGICFPSFRLNGDSLSVLAVARFHNGANVSMVYSATLPGAPALVKPSLADPLPPGWHKADLQERARGVYGGGVRWSRALVERGLKLCVAFVLKDDQSVFMDDNEGDLYWPLSANPEAGLGGEIRHSYGFRKSGFRPEDLITLEVERGESRVHKGERRREEIGSGLASPPFAFRDEFMT
ncbi:hypothetical protein KIPB_010040, partial [Kipferlia bialata]